LPNGGDELKVEPQYITLETAVDFL